MAHWYYSKNDQQHGPVSDEEMQSLVANGTIASADEVWRDGMDDWLPLSQVPELGGERPLAPPPAPGTARPRASGANAAMGLLNVDPLRRAGPAGPWLLLTGFLLVIWAKGCDSVGRRDVARTADDYRTAVAEFDHSYEMRQARLQVEKDEINDKTTQSDYDRRRLEDIDESLVELQDERDDARRRLSRITWPELQHDAETAAAWQLWWAYYNEIFFVFGSMALVVGLLIVGLTGEGAARWLCLTMLAIITFSLFVGGVAWVGALVR